MGASAPVRMGKGRVSLTQDQIHLSVSALGIAQGCDGDHKNADFE
jgi:hypothetical protein